MATLFDLMRSPEAVEAHRPPLVLLALEARAIGELGAHVAARPVLARAPRGDGHSVLVIPGWGTSDSATGPLRRYLASLGHDVHGWGGGRNMGPDDATIEYLDARLISIAEQSGGPVSVIGWSLGGIYARWLSHRHPELVRRVVTLGSPMHASRPGHSNVSFVFLRFGRRPSERLLDSIGDLDTLRKPHPTIPSTAVFSRFDGAVPPRICRDARGPGRESIEVFGSHCGLPHHPASSYAVADRLALPAGALPPFRPPLLLRASFGRLLAAE